MIYWRKSWFCYLHQKSIEFSLPGSYIFGGSLYLVKVLVLDFIRVNLWASQVALMLKNPPANAVDIRDTCLIPGSGRSPGRGHDTSSSILVGRTPWREEPGRLQSIGLQRVGCEKWHSMHTFRVDLHLLSFSYTNVAPYFEKDFYS